MSTVSLYYMEEGSPCLPFDPEKTARTVIEKALDYVGCPYEAEVSLLVAADTEIREMNRTHRQIDAPTDVLSFPMLEYGAPGDFTGLEDRADAFNPETGELLLGDIMVSRDRVLKQAEEYGHSPLREFSFLIAHSMLHLFGYDHIEEDERLDMEQKQREILEQLGILR